MLSKNINLQNLFSSLIFISLLNLVFNPINLYLGFLILLFFVLIFIYIQISNFALLPFYFYPFLFIFKIKYPEYLLFSVLPELSIFVSFIYVFFDQKIKKSEKYLFFLVILLSFSLTFSNFLFIFDIYFLPALIRQYALPIIFLIFFIAVSLNNHQLPREAFRICIIAYGLISIIALLNYFDVINVLQINVYRYFSGCSNNIIQTFLTCKNLALLRINPLLGGSIGTSGSLLLMLAIANILNYKKKEILIIFFSIPLIFSAFFSISFSTIIPITFAVAVIFLSKYRIYFKQIFLVLIILFILFMINFSFAGEKSFFSYFKLTILTSLIDHYSKINLLNIFFGSGPIINSSKFGYFPNHFIQDIGILRILTESGIFNFFLVILILLYFLKKSIWIVVNYPSNYNKSLLIMFLTLISSIHTIIFLGIPFYPLFVMIVSNIILQYNLLNKTS